LPRPGIKEWQRSKIHRRGPYPLEHGLYLKARWAAQGKSKATIPESTQLVLHILPAAPLDRLTGLVA
jgi:hypothetical protein